MTTVTGKKKRAKKRTTKRKTQQGENMTADNMSFDYGEPQVTRKITNKTVLGKLLDDKPEEETVLYTLMGIIRGYQTGNTEYGQFIKFRGDFEAFNHVEQRSFRAPTCIIPVPMDDVLANQYDQTVAAMVDAETGELPKNKKPECRFAVDIGYKPSDTPTGYEWTVSSRVKMQENDAMLALKRQVLGIEQLDEE